MPVIHFVNHLVSTNSSYAHAHWVAHGIWKILIFFFFFQEKECLSKALG